MTTQSCNKIIQVAVVEKLNDTIEVGEKIEDYIERRQSVRLSVWTGEGHGVNKKNKTLRTRLHAMASTMICLIA